MPPAPSRRLFIALCALCALRALTATPARAQTFLLDFGNSGTTTTNGASPDDPLRFWNNITDSIGGADTGQLLNLITSGNTATAVDFLMVSRFNWSNTNGTLASTLYPQDATRDSLYGNTEPFSGGNPAGTIGNVFPSFKLSSLDPNSTYDLKFYASRTGVSDNRETVYTISGALSGSVTLNPANNIDTTVTYFSMPPSVAGEITISLSPSVLNNNPNHFTYMGVLEVTAMPVPEPAGVGLVLAGCAVLGRRRERRKVVPDFSRPNLALL